MASWSRLGRVGILVIPVATAAVACGTDDRPFTPEPGAAAREVTVVRGEQTYPVTAEVTAWKTTVHPQAPERGPAVHFHYRFTSGNRWAAMERVELQACAVDGRRVVILCTLIVKDSLADGWFGPSTEPDLARTTDVLLLPYQMYAGPHAGDPKDHDGYVPPRILSPGSQL